MHLQIAHALWRQHLSKDSHVIDATLGNGHDFLILAHLLGPKGRLSGYDIQEAALQKCRERLEATLAFPELTLHLQCHSALLEKENDLVVYNLGYLPGSDKSCTTKVETTLKSLSSALFSLREGGALSIMTYPGHEEGAREHEAVCCWLSNQPSLHTIHFKRSDRRRAPHLFFATLRAPLEK